MKPTSIKGLLKIAGMTFALVLIIIAIIWLILRGYAATWTGFGDFTSPNGEFVRGRTLWDWMELLIIPLALAIGVFVLNHSEREIERQRADKRAERERREAQERKLHEKADEMARDAVEQMRLLNQQQEAILQSYLDRMSNLLIKEKLGTTESKEIRDVARILTLTSLRGLDSRRKGLIVLFLWEAGLIRRIKETDPIINLAGADLSGAKLNKMLLANSDFIGANLSGANLEHSILSFSSLAHANLQGASLRNAILTSVNFTGADLTGANMTHAIFDQTVLQDTTLIDAIMPDGTKHS